MANSDIKVGLHPKNIKNADCNRYYAYPGATTKDGDVVTFYAEGRVGGILDASYPLCGVQNGPIYRESDGSVQTTAAAGDVVKVWDNPLEVFIGQISSYAITNPVTTSVSSGCFDIAGSAGAQYINASASTYDDVRVLKLSQEYDTGKESAVGAYAKVECQLNPSIHFRTKVS